MVVARDDLLKQSTHFAFGDNWLDFASRIDEDRVARAVLDLRRLARGDLKGKSFLDIGCGSGLHAIAALRLGASRVAGFDIDPQSVEAARRTVGAFAEGAHARFDVLSVFDARPESVGVFDVVYSWGVLHHTGDMYRAIRAAASLVSPDGELQIALYKKTPFCSMWRGIKRWYSRASSTQQRRARRVYKTLIELSMRMRGVDFQKFVDSYGNHRGMNYENDVHDWLGGFPYESIAPGECVSFMTRLGFRLQRSFVRTPGRFLPGLLGSGCDEYVFVRASTGPGDA